MLIPPEHAANLNTELDILITLQDVPYNVLAEWYCWCNSNDIECHWKQSIQVMDVIQEIIGHEACSREWNRKSMPDSEHKKWFKKTFINK